MRPEDIRSGIRKIKSYGERNGTAALFFRLVEGAGEVLENRRYSLERERTVPAVPLKERETEGAFISVIIPVCDPDPDHFAHLLDSLMLQTYINFEVVMADGSGGDLAKRVVDAYREDPGVCFNIVYKRLKKNLGISGNTNEALKDAAGEYVSFVDQDDFLEPEALYETVQKIRDGALMVYTDEDKYDSLTERFLTPNRKPDFNLDLLLSNNYISHLLTVKRNKVEEAGGFRSEFDGAQDHDLLLRLSRVLPRETIAHIDRVLYHWRLSPSSTAGNPESKLYAYTSGKKAVEAYFRERGLEVTINDTAHRGFFHPDYSSLSVSRDEYILFVDRRLEPLDPEFEERMAGYFSRAEVGIVGARIIGRNGRTLYNGYKLSKNGEMVPEYGKIDHRFSGYMHRASMARETEAVSIHAFAVRSSLKDLISGDTFSMCDKIRKRGFSVIVDPRIIFRIK